MKKLRSRSGMTLTEMLCALVVLMLISALLAVGVRFGVQTYRTSMADSQAQVLCSTVTAAIEDKLRYCGSVSKENGKLFIQGIGSVSGNGDGGFFSVNDDGQIVLDAADETGEKKLLGSKSYPRGLKIAKIAEDDLITFDQTSGIFHVKFKVTDTAGTTLASSEFDVKRINEVSAEPSDGESGETDTGTGGEDTGTGAGTGEGA